MYAVYTTIKMLLWHHLKLMTGIRRFSGAGWLKKSKLQLQLHNGCYNFTMDLLPLFYITQVVKRSKEFNALECIRLLIVCSGVEEFWKFTQIECGCNFVS